MKKQILLACLLLWCVAVSAQSNFRPGYVVALAGDTLRGEVDYRDAQRSSQLCRFRTAAGATVQQYQPAQLLGYGFLAGRMLEAQTITDQDGYAQSYFCEVLVRGQASLYLMRDNQGRDHYYLAMQPAGLVELIQANSTLTTAQGVLVRQDQSFRRTLASAFRTCFEVQPELPQLPFKASALVAVVQHYNRCQGGGVVVSAQQDLVRGSAFSVSLLAGIGLTKNSFEGETSLSKGSFQDNFVPQFGIGLQFQPRARRNKLAIRVEALYEKQNYADTYGAQTLFSRVEDRTTLTVDYLRFPLLLRYHYQLPQFRFFIQAGFVNSFYLQQNLATIRRNVPGPPSEPFPYANNLPARRYEQGAMVGLGALFGAAGQRTLSVEVRAERSNGFVNATGSTNLVTHLHVLLGYALTK